VFLTATSALYSSSSCTASTWPPEHA